MDIRLMVQSTPNPNALKFVLNIPVKTDGKVTYKRIEDCVHNPLAMKIFGLDHIEEVFSLTITSRSRKTATPTGTSSRNRSKRPSWTTFRPTTLISKPKSPSELCRQPTTRKSPELRKSLTKPSVRPCRWTGETSRSSPWKITSSWSTTRAPAAPAPAPAWARSRPSRIF